FVIAGLYAGFGREPVRGASDHVRSATDRATVFGIFRNPAFLTATMGLATLTFAMGGISAWMPTFLHRNVGLSVANASLTVGAITVVDGIAGTLTGRLDCADLAAHQLPRALPALILERAADAAVWRDDLLWSTRVDDPFVICGGVLSLPQHGAAERGHRELGFRSGARYCNLRQPLLHSLFRRHVLSADYRRHIGSLESQHRAWRNADLPGHLRADSASGCAMCASAGRPNSARSLMR